MKQEKRTGVANENSVSFFRYVEVVYKGNAYRLGKTVGSKFSLTINGIAQTKFFEGEVSFSRAGKDLLLSIDIGLKVFWDGNQKVTVKLCDSYKSHVCGLCGNFDGKIK